ncbi:Zinc finger protein 330-like protein [Acropora cervicornis]|uniref:Zinc finger protein 330-like protein n=1 Tax=Acropora cervicornis TaxID=6130 RepID=A0AAD9Q4Q3_ACRCE|nr:Zinc finger protein 330-like protein [Acropora cervicornis]
MPKKKTGARKKSDRQRERLRGIREARDRPITEYFCNVTMDFLIHMTKKILLFIIIGKTKCMAKTGDCVVKHGTTFTTGFGMVGAICDFCEAFVCHSKKCLTTHACECALRGGECIECERGVWEHGKLL